MLKLRWEGIASPVGDQGPVMPLILPGGLGTPSNCFAHCLLLELRLSVTLVRLILMRASLKAESSPYVQPCMWLREVPWMGSVSVISLSPWVDGSLPGLQGKMLAGIHESKDISSPT